MPVPERSVFQPRGTDMYARAAVTPFSSIHVAGNAAMKKNSLRIALAAIFCFASAALSAAEFDGSKPLLCATIDAHACDPGQVCERALPADLGAPQFLRIDFAKKTVTGPQRTTQIRFMQTDQNQILLQGTEFSFGWTMVLDREDGSITLTLVNREDALVLFGACTAM
jgi:hypothetical protein